MSLSQEDCTLFHELYQGLLAYTSRADNVVAHVKELEDIISGDLSALGVIRNYLYDHPENFDNFIRDTPNLSAEHAQIIRDWKQYFVRGTFYVVKHTAQYSEFATDSDKHSVYAVQSLTTPLKELIPEIPFMVDTVLLPFKGGITADGLFNAKNVHFGSRMSKSIKMESERDKMQYGLIRTLPTEPVHGAGDTRTLLEFYCRSQANFEEYYTERNALLEAHPELMDTYFQLIGKLAARGLKKELQKVLRAKMYCAVYKETVVACGGSQEELDRIIEAGVAPQYRAKLYKFDVQPAWSGV